MNAEEFYEEFKAALNYLEIPWGRKEEVEIYVNENSFVMTANGKLVSFELKGTL